MHSCRSAGASPLPARQARARSRRRAPRARAKAARTGKCSGHLCMHSAAAHLPPVARVWRCCRRPACMAHQRNQSFCNPVQPKAQGEGWAQAAHWSISAVLEGLPPRLPAGKEGGLPGRLGWEAALSARLAWCSSRLANGLHSCPNRSSAGRWGPGLTAFNATCSPMQARPDVTVTSREIASAAGAAWRALSADLKQQYESRGDAEKVGRI